MRLVIFTVKILRQQPDDGVARKLENILFSVVCSVRVGERQNTGRQRDLNPILLPPKCAHPTAVSAVEYRL